MTIISYQYKDVDQPGWKFSKIELGKINLFVGVTGSGKTRILNTIFNIASYATGKSLLSPGKWNIKIEQNGSIYRWVVTAAIDKGETIYKEEKISKIVGKKEVSIVERNKNEFKFDGTVLPKLPKNKSSISLLKDEKIIKPINKCMSNILRRSFFEAHLKDAVGYTSLSNNIIKKIEKENEVGSLFGGKFDISAKLWFMKNFFQENYQLVCDYYMETFPFITRVEVRDMRKVDPEGPLLNLTPAFCIKERNVKKWILLQELSSGMQKVLLLLTDICTMPLGATYLIDEYENSLGINAIDSFPDFLLEHELNTQIIITSHHPYMINNIHPKHWFVFHRKGGDVTIKYGDEFVEKMGKSKQQYFFQLINDPFYVEGIG